MARTPEELNDTVWVWEVITNKETQIVCSMIESAEFNGRYIGSMTLREFNQTYRKAKKAEKAAEKKAQTPTIKKIQKPRLTKELKKVARR